MATEREPKTVKAKIHYCLSAVFPAVFGFVAGHLFQLLACSVIFSASKGPQVSGWSFFLTAAIWSVVFTTPFLCVRISTKQYRVPTLVEYLRSLGFGVIGSIAFAFPVSVAFAIYLDTPDSHSWTYEIETLLYPMFPVVALVSMLFVTVRFKSDGKSVT